MKVRLDCPHGEHRGGVVYCKKTGEPCGHQYFKSCKGWWVNSPSAAKCPLRREETHGTGTAPA